MDEERKEHELQVVKRLIADACARAGGQPVLEVTIAGAACSHLEEGLLRFYWDQYAAGTVCHGARIFYRQVPFIQQCPYCGYKFAARKQNAACPQCRAEHTATLVGDDCAIVEGLTLAA